MSADSVRGLLASGANAIHKDQRHERRHNCCSQCEQKYGHKPLKSNDYSIHNQNTKRDVDTNKRDRHELECHLINSLNK